MGLGRPRGGLGASWVWLGGRRSGRAEIRRQNGEISAWFWEVWEHEKSIERHQRNTPRAKKSEKDEKWKSEFDVVIHSQDGLRGGKSGRKVRKSRKSEEFHDNSEI